MWKAEFLGKDGAHLWRVIRGADDLNHATRIAFNMGLNRGWHLLQLEPFYA